MAFGFLRIVRYRLRILLRAAFLLLALATLGLAVSVLQQEKQLSYNNYQAGFQKTAQQIGATLRHPSGQLALLNPPRGGPAAAPLHPVLLPYASLDFDDQNKVEQAVALSGCLVQYGTSGNLCVGVGNNAWHGGYVYVAGSFDSTALVAHQRGDAILDQSHRVLVSLAMRGQQYAWIAPFELAPDEPGTKSGPGLRGRLTGFKAGLSTYRNLKPVRDFRGWIWQNDACTIQSATSDNCLRNAFFSIRLPVDVLRDALFDSKRPVWPPADLAQIAVRVTVLAPGTGPPLLDSSAGSAVKPFALSDLRSALLPGETLRIRKLDGATQPTLVELTGPVPEAHPSWQLLTSLIRQLPVDAYDVPLSATDIIAIPSGRYEVALNGDVRSVSKSLSVVASRLSWFVGAMLLALLLAWLVVEVGVISRVRALTRRADSVAKTVKGQGAADEFDVSDLRGEDELGVLASCLHDLLRRVREDVERETIRAEQERDMWHAVGHEIMSPLQALMAMHAAGDEQSKRYLARMQQAIRVLYGSASPSEAFQASVIQVGELDLSAFLEHVAVNAPFSGIDKVRFAGSAGQVVARADAYCLEDVVTHVLKNAARYRTEGSAILLTLDATQTGATITIFNRGPRVDEELIGKVFEYGVSDQPDSGAAGNRGQGLFVAKIYMAKMGGTISLSNQPDGVAVVLSLQRVLH
ncbi:HAMP domain-containing sensor histidine kinase [Massilia sp. CF038]|uniref:sensor histidine kinase n=1 Tax=Massilia sp. CF038 TaxID=1881045 RepID=UPI00091A6625|nr:sensor histidine kinase [Massilia sp. CF038]SHH72759.1 Signal transduction histidine kinase [Massilia sp. CF038]